MTNPKKVAAVFGRPWLNPQSDVLNGFDLGRLALAYLGSDCVFIHAHSFSFLPYLISEMGISEFRKELESKRLNFIFQPESIGLMRLTGESRDHLGLIVFPANAAEIRDKSKAAAFIAEQVAENQFFDVSLSPADSALVADATVFPELEAKDLLDRMGFDLLDLGVRKEVAAFAKTHLSEDVDLLDLIQVELRGKKSSIFRRNATGAGGAKVDRQVQTLLFMLYQAYTQVLSCRVVGADFIYTDRPVFDLAACIARAKPGAAQKSNAETIETIAKAIKLPNIAWLVNRSLLSIKEILKFHESANGKKFRQYVEVLAGGGDVDETLIFQTLIQSFHDQRWWERAWDAEATKWMRFFVTGGVGLIPGWGTAIGIGTALVDRGIDAALPRKFRPTIVLDETFASKIDLERLDSERQQRHTYPSIQKLIKQGYRPTLALKLRGERYCLLLDLPGQEGHWELGIDIADPAGKKYLADFISLLPAAGTPERELTDHLGDGWTMEQLQTKFTVNGPGIELIYTLAKNGGAKVVQGNSRSFWDFTRSVSYLSDPRSCNAKLAKLKHEE